MPASRRQRATTLAPRSWPSRPTLAISTRRGRTGMAPVWRWPLDVRAAAGAPVLCALHEWPGDRADGRRRAAAVAGRLRGGPRRRLEDFADFEGEGIRSERLGEKGDALAEHTMTHDGVVGVT